MDNIKGLSCIDCTVKNCDSGNKHYPSFCISKKLEPQILYDVKQKYHEELNNKIMISSAEVEYDNYCKMTRVQEIIEWAKKINARKIGIATCVGLLHESRTFAKVLRNHGFEVYGVGCKIGEITKEEIGISKRCSNIGANTCNPILQAELLSKENTDINVLIGLCVGHDSLFYKYSKAPVTTLITKDRVLGHNPVAVLYTADTYYNEKLNK